MNAGKVTLAKDFMEAQEKVHGVDGASVEKCIKLTKDLKSKTSEVKSMDKERNDLKTSLSKWQNDINLKNNKIAELEAQNVKLKDFNNKMYEICKSKGIFEELKAKDKKELDTQKRVFEDKAESKQSDRHGNKPKHFKATKPSIDEAKEHCWFWENGYCRKGIKCSCYHPVYAILESWRM